MREVFIHDAVRTPRGKARRDGGLAGLTPYQLVGLQVDALRERAGDLANRPDALYLGCVGQVADQGGHIALASKFHAGLPDACAAHTINNYCASGLTAIGHGVAKVASGQADVVIAGGVECMSRVPFMGDQATYYSDPAFPSRTRYIPVVLAADRLANSEGLTRAELDAVALTSQEKAHRAEANPALLRSRIPTGDLEAEECPRPGTDVQGLAAMPPAFGALQDEYADALGGARFEPLHTLGHAPPVCDGAGLALLAGPGQGRARARVVAFAESGGDPAASLTAGLMAMDRVLAQAGLTLDQIDRIEFMESFAVTIAKFMRDRQPDPARVNVSGGHIAKGHPMGATGAILLSTLLDCLDACGGRLGLVVVSGAAGTGAAMVVERLGSSGLTQI